MIPFILSFRVHGLNSEIHKHAAIQLVFSNGSAFNSSLNSNYQKGIVGFLIKPNITHLCTENSDTLNIINIEPYSPTGVYILSNLLKDSSCIAFNSVNEIVRFFQLSYSKENHDLMSQVIESLTRNQVKEYTDERIKKIIEYIRINYADHLTPKVLSEMVYLSPSRTSSLFKQETGSSLPKYLLWTRIREAVKLMLTEQELTLTKIALETGFYDLPQLHKYVYEMLGVSSKVFRQNSDLIQVW